jgi:hypothetical protein
MEGIGVRSEIKLLVWGSPDARHHPGDRFVIVAGKGVPILAQLTPDSFEREPKLGLSHLINTRLATQPDMAVKLLKFVDWETLPKESFMALSGVISHLLALPFTPASNNLIREAFPQFARCAFFGRSYTRGCHWITRMFA